MLNNIGIGIFCFGDDIYFKGTVNKINSLLSLGFECYVLTDNTDFFSNRYFETYLHLIPYNREVKSYSDKMILPKYIFEKHDIAILIDADTDIKDFKVFNKLKDFPFKDGISYIDTLLNHNCKKEFVRDLIKVDNVEWKGYDDYLKKLYPMYGDLETIWEYFLVINKKGLKRSEFYGYYEKIQIVKEYCDITLNKLISGAGEGITIQVAALKSNTPISKDNYLATILKDSIRGVSKIYTSPKDLPNFMK